MSGQLQLQLGQELEKSRMKSSRMSVSSGTRAVRLRGLSVALLLLWTCVCADCTDHNVSAVAGETAVLPCHCPSLPPLFLLWQKYDGGQQLVVKNYIEDDPEDKSEAEYRDRTELRLSGDCALLLHHVNPSDQGRYYCIYQRAPLRYDRIYLEVKGRVDHNVSAVAGETAVLPCQCPSERPLFLFWLKADGPQQIIAIYYREDDDTEDQFKAKYRDRAEVRLSGDCALLLHHVNPSDQGRYYCYYQKEPRRYDRIYLEVKEPPSPPICKIEGVAEYYEDIKLTCRSSEGKPAPTYRWQRHDSNNVPQPIPANATDQNGVLSLYSITKEMSGFYICTSTNEIRSETCNLTLAVMPLNFCLKR